MCAVLIGGASTAYANNPPAGNPSGVVLHSTGQLTSEDPSVAGPVAEVKPGQTFTITGACVMPAGTSESLRVVLTIADQASGAAPCFRSVLATDQEISGSGLEVRVPAMPQAENHVFDVRIFRLGDQMPQICDAGSIRIGAASQGKLG